MDYILAPSILSADFANLGADVKEAVEAGAKWVHIDVMDGMFVPNISLGFPVIKSLRKVTDAVFDVHLMIEEPGRYIDEFAAVGADVITLHAEATKHLHRTIQQVKAKGLKVGVSLNPATPLSALDYVLEDIGIWEKTGYKHHAWHDVIWLCLPLGNFGGVPAEPIPLKELH